MRRIPFATVVQEVTSLCRKAAVHLPEEVKQSLRKAAESDSEAPLGTTILSQCIRNAELAEQGNIPLCQDTGFAVFFIEFGRDLRIEGGNLNQAITDGTARGYREGYLRNSIVQDPLFERRNTGDNTPPIIHLDMVDGDELRITLAPKGGGSENMSALTMLRPSDGRRGVVDFVYRTVTEAGGNPCPPTIVGVGIGGTFEKAAYLAKKALIRPIGSRHPDTKYQELEDELLTLLNRSGVGPQGLGGATTALDVHIETFPCHIASLPVAVNLNCHAARHASVLI